MTKNEIPDYQLIDNETDLIKFANQNEDVEWMGFDTEFIGEKRYYTLLCLIQVATVHGNYLIDSIKIKDLNPFFDLIENPDILKITHAGENDYRILNNQYDVIPQNVFDTQIGAGFIGYRYPLSFGKLLDSELGVRISKGYTVTDWKARPLKNKQVKYALNDVIYLEELYQKIKDQLEHFDRVEWMKNEMSIWESDEYYEEDEHAEALNNRLMNQARTREKVFLLRLFQWRRERAKELNYSKEMILPKKIVGTIVMNISSGKGTLKDNRTINSKLIDKNWDTFNRLYQAPITDEEKEILGRVRKHMDLTPAEELSAELLYLIIKKRCMDSEIASELMISKNNLKKLRWEANFEDHKLMNGWRRDFLGEDLMDWLKLDGDLKMEMKDGKCIIEKIAK